MEHGLVFDWIQIDMYAWAKNSHLFLFRFGGVVVLVCFVFSFSRFDLSSLVELQMMLWYCTPTKDLTT